MAPKDALPPDHQEVLRAVSDRPVRVGTVTFGDAALRLLDNGYAPLPLVPGQKRPVPQNWTDVAIDAGMVERWARQYPHHGIGLRTGHLVAVDIDILDPELAHNVDRLVRDRLGETLLRVGHWPKRALLYRTDEPFAKLSIGKVEVLAAGQQLVGFGLHPATRRAYSWPLGESPLEVPLIALPSVDRRTCADLLSELAGLLPQAPKPRSGARTATGNGEAPVVRNADGIIVDGRDGLLSRFAFHAVQDALVLGEPLDESVLAEQVWNRFTKSTALDRPSPSGARYGPSDAGRKVADKVRLLAADRLPLRAQAVALVPGPPAAIDASVARMQLQEHMEEACVRIATWYGDGNGPAPHLGVRATVGLGKSRMARHAVLGLHKHLLAQDCRPSRILVLTPSLALADEAAAAWRDGGISVAVHRGYEAEDPLTGDPLCRDLPAVRAAIEARIEVQAAACASPDGRRCAFFEGCAKQENLREVGTADVVIAAYDALYSGLPFDPSTIAVVLVDEGCWSRAVEEIGGVIVQSFTQSDDADLRQLRQLAADALVANGPGSLSRATVIAAGLTVDGCRRAIQLEARHLGRPGLYPGMSTAERRAQHALIAAHRHRQGLIAVWETMATLCAGETDQDGRLHVRGRADGLHDLVLTRLRSVHRDLREKPLLYLDATLRPRIARAILPRLEVIEVAAAMPNTTLSLVLGSFGKGQLCPDRRAPALETRRRANRLQECVEYVAWHARRVAPGRILVVTYKAIEGAFSGLPNVAVAHFNAIAGLDRYRDVALLMVIGRPLPQDDDLHPLCAAFFGHMPEGSYQDALRAVRLRDGTTRTIRAIAHQDETAELFRVAICDDEVLQAIGRGRGVNRCADNPLEVKVLADVALPLVHDQILDWESVKPDIVQRMLLRGIAVDSPGDALRLHPALFASRAAAEKGFQREGFGGHFPIRDLCG